MGVPDTQPFQAGSQLIGRFVKLTLSIKEWIKDFMGGVVELKGISAQLDVKVVPDSG